MNQEFINAIITTVLLPLAGVLVKFGVAYIQAKIANIQQRTENELLQNSLCILSDEIGQTVTYINQTLVDNLKAENLFNVEKQKEVLETVKNDVIKSISSTTIKILKEGFELDDKGFEDWVIKKIESCVKQYK